MVVVLFRPVKFWRVVEPRATMFVPVKVFPVSVPPVAPVKKRLVVLAVVV